jgi:hypothetical protein
LGRIPKFYPTRYAEGLWILPDVLARKININPGEDKEKEPGAFGFQNGNKKRPEERIFSLRCSFPHALGGDIAFC